MARFAETCQGVIGIDVKVLRRSFDSASAKSALYMVSAWDCEQRLVLGQIATDAKSNEITAVPKLLEMLSLKGCIVTVGALNCQRYITRQIIGQRGDYTLALKRIQATLHDDIRMFLGDPATEAYDAHISVDAGRSRIKTRIVLKALDRRGSIRSLDRTGLM
jgi:predicted transposase YbfD/YdcC